MVMILFHYEQIRYHNLNVLLTKVLMDVCRWYRAITHCIHTQRWAVRAGADSTSIQWHGKKCSQFIFIVKTVISAHLSIRSFIDTLHQHSLQEIFNHVAADIEIFINKVGAALSTSDESKKKKKEKNAKKQGIWLQMCKKNQLNSLKLIILILMLFLF